MFFCGANFQKEASLGMRTRTPRRKPVGLLDVDGGVLISSFGVEFVGSSLVAVHELIDSALVLLLASKDLLLEPGFFLF